MNTNKFTKQISNPKKLNKKQIGGLRSLIDEFPYFQAARALYLKSLKDLESFKYNHELKITAAYTADRSVLFDFITQKNFGQNQISKIINKGEAQLKELELHSFVDISVSNPRAKELKEKNTQKIEIGSPLEFSSEERHSFNEWLKISTFTPIDRSNSEKTNSPKKSVTLSDKLDLIDNFIDKNPKIPAVNKNAPLNDLSNQNNATIGMLMTETLARVYAEQKNYESAIKAYEILSLKYPEKSSLFANHIQSLKELKEKNKKP
jgi:hypothetical protein